MKQQSEQGIGYNLECHLHFNVTLNTFQLKDFHMQIPDRMIFHFHSVLSVTSLSQAWLLLLPFAVKDSSQSPSGKDVYLPSLTECS